MAGLVADTHSVVWFVLEAPDLSYTARKQMRDTLVVGDKIHLSAISLIEIVYLVEKDRIPRAALDRLLAFIADSESGLIVVPVDVPVAQALRQISREDIPDMPDRIIAATALTLRLPLITKDAKIRATNIATIW
jgi:PIN domain nuclease of toxin-antitoxin system